MSRLLLTIPLFFLSISSAFAITTQEEQLIVDNALAVFGQNELNLPDTIQVHRICGTATIMEAKRRFGELSPKAQAALAPLLYPRPALQKSYAPPSGRFRIHYDTSGTGAVRDVAIKNAQGIPVWVDTLAMVLDSIWNKEVTQMGFRPPVSDGFYTPNGGDGRFDVYLDELSGGVLGYTAPDSAGGILGNRATAFMVLDNDYIGIPGYSDPIDQRRVLRVTAAHEFFHALQFAYNYFGFELVGGVPKFYWQEATAVWMEDQMYNEINDYIQYLPFWFSRPEYSFRTFSTDYTIDPYRSFRPYALGIYGLFLSKRFPNPPYGYTVVRGIWENMATVAGFNLFSAIDSALAPMGYNFLSSLQEFYQWNYFVGNNRPLNMSLYAPEDSIWPTFDQHKKVDSTTAYPTQFPEINPCGSCPPGSIAFFCAPCDTIGPPCETQCPPSCRFVPYQPTDLTIINCINDLEDLGVSYLNLKNPGGGSFIAFALVSDTGRPAPWRASANGYNSVSRTVTVLTTRATDPSGRIPEIFFSDFGNYTEIVVMVMNNELLTADAPRQSSAYAYSANVDSSAPPSITSILDVRPNPFRPEIDQYVKFPVVLDSLSGTWEITLIVFSSAGEIVCRKSYTLSGGFTYNETVGWYGKNGDDASGLHVASGVYFCRLMMKEKGTSRKLEKTAKIALIRQ